MRFEEDITFVIRRGLIRRINKCIEDTNPNEACGFLFGDIKEINNHGDFKYTYLCKFFQCIESSVSSPVSFLLDNDEKILELYRTYVQKYGSPTQMPSAKIELLMTFEEVGYA